MTIGQKDMLLRVSLSYLAAHLVRSVVVDYTTIYMTSWSTVYSTCIYSIYSYTFRYSIAMLLYAVYTYARIVRFILYR